MQVCSYKYVHFDLSIAIVSDVVVLLISIVMKTDENVQGKGRWARKTTQTRNPSSSYTTELPTTEKEEKRRLPDVNVRFSNNCTICPDIYLPVCTNKSRTYQNACLFLCVRRKREGIVRRGVCILFRRSDGPQLPRFPTFRRY